MKKLFLFCCAFLIMFGLINIANAAPYMSPIYDMTGTWGMISDSGFNDSNPYILDTIQNGNSFESYNNGILVATGTISGDKYTFNNSRPYPTIPAYYYGTGYYKWYNCIFTVNSDSKLTGTLDWTLYTNEGEEQYSGVNHSFTGSRVVPVPGALWLFVSGLIGLVGYRRKFKE